MKTVFITFSSFPRDRDYTMLSVINHGEVLHDGKIKYVTEAGEQIKTEEGICNSSVNIITEDKINIKDSLYNWYKKNQDNLNKPLIKDEALEIGEEYRGNSWRYGLRLLVTATEIKYNLILE